MRPSLTRRFRRRLYDKFSFEVAILIAGSDRFIYLRNHRVIVAALVGNMCKTIQVCRVRGIISEQVPIIRLSAIQSAGDLVNLDDFGGGSIAVIFIPHRFEQLERLVVFFCAHELDGAGIRVQVGKRGLAV